MSTTIENNNQNDNNVENFATIDEAIREAPLTKMSSEEFAKSMEKRLGKLFFFYFVKQILKLINKKYSFTTEKVWSQHESHLEEHWRASKHLQRRYLFEERARWRCDSSIGSSHKSFQCW